MYTNMYMYTCMYMYVRMLKKKKKIQAYNNARPVCMITFTTKVYVINSVLKMS